MRGLVPCGEDYMHVIGFETTVEGSGLITEGSGLITPRLEGSGL